MIASHLFLERRKLILQTAQITQGENPALSITSGTDASLSQDYVSADGLSTANGRLTRMTWRVDMSRVLGDWWGKHHLFSIRLVSFAFMNHNAFTRNAYNRWTSLEMSGLKWHQNYDPSISQNNGRKMAWCGSDHTLAANKNYTFYSSGSTPRMTFDFTNGDRFVDITLEWFMMETGNGSLTPLFPTTANLSYTYPLGSYAFEILPVDESDKPFEPQSNHFIIKN
jgi:hypothetical protein